MKGGEGERGLNPCINCNVIRKFESLLLMYVRVIRNFIVTTCTTKIRV